MITPRQQELIDRLNERPEWPAAELRDELGLSRARISQLVGPLIKSGLVKREGAARATIYRLTDRRGPGQIRRENWALRQKVKQLEQTLDNRKMIERAKEVISAEFDIPVTEAYRKMQEQSMESGRSMSEIAEKIVSAYEI